MADTLGSPFKCGGVKKSFPARKFDVLIVRIDNASDTDKVIFTTSGKDTTPAADNANGYLMGGESIEFDGQDFQTADQIVLLNISGDPDIYWDMK